MRQNKNRNNQIPRALLKSLAADITVLMGSNEGRLLALQIMDEVPYDLRPQFIESLSSFYEPEILLFFHLVEEEYGQELAAECERARGKLALAGVSLPPAKEQERVFYRAYATRTRHLGQIKLEVATLRLPERVLEVECYILAFHSDGLYSFQIISDVPVDLFEREHRGRDEFLELNEREVSYLIRKAYEQNVTYMTPAALGRFLYGRYLDGASLASLHLGELLCRRLTPHLSPLELVNSFLYASRYGDVSFMASVTVGGEEALTAVPELISDAYVLMEAQVVREVTEGNMAMLFVTAVTAAGDDMYRSEYVFTLLKKGTRWIIEHINRYRQERLLEESKDNPFSRPVYCGVHRLIDIDGVFFGLERFEDVREIGELPYGTHLRITRPEVDRRRGVTFMTGILADIVINGEEVVIIADDERVTRMVGETITRSGGTVPLSEHVVDIMTAYSYVSGSYTSFEQAVMRDEEPALEENMRFTTIRYLTSDAAKVRSKLEGVYGRRFDLPDCEAVYELEIKDGEEMLKAEYLIGRGWVTLSAFGDAELSRARAWFEEDLRPVLEFDGLQIREYGLLGILDAETVEASPELGPFLKRLYLNHWYKAKQPRLNGMSPSEAEKSPEGRQLLWSLVKEMRKRDKKGLPGAGLGWRDYISRVNLGTEK